MITERLIVFFVGNVQREKNNQNKCYLFWNVCFWSVLFELLCRLSKSFVYTFQVSGRGGVRGVEVALKR